MIACESHIDYKNGNKKKILMLKLFFLENIYLKKILLWLKVYFFPVSSTEQNTTKYGCCYGYKWNDVVNNCVGKSSAISCHRNICILKQLIPIKTFNNTNIIHISLFYSVQAWLYRARMFSFMSVSIVWTWVSAIVFVFHNWVWFCIWMS